MEQKTEMISSLWVFKGNLRHLILRLTKVLEHLQLITTPLTTLVTKHIKLWSPLIQVHFDICTLWRSWNVKHLVTSWVSCPRIICITICLFISAKQVMTMWFLWFKYSLHCILFSLKVQCNVTELTYDFPRHSVLKAHEFLVVKVTPLAQMSGPFMWQFCMWRLIKGFL